MDEALVKSATIYTDSREQALAGAGLFSIYLLFTTFRKFEACLYQYQKEVSVCIYNLINIKSLFLMLLVCLLNILLFS